MKKIGFFVTCILLSTATLFAQMEMDAYRYSQTELTGSARSVAMGGAFGALGGDISALTSNPAGLGVYQSSEVVTTLNFMNNKATTNMKGISMNDTRFTFSLDNIGSVLSFSNNNGGRFNMGFSFNKKYSYNNRYNVSGKNMSSSLADYIAETTNRWNNNGGIHKDDLLIENGNYPFEYGYSWLSVMGYNSFLINPQTTGKPDNDNYYYNPIYPNSDVNSTMSVDERGSASDYTFSLGGSMLDDKLYMGGSFALTDIDYRMESIFEEKFQGNKEGSYRLRNSLETEGIGFNMKLGVIFRPINAIRIGAAYHSPSWHTLTDRYSAAIIPNGIRYEDNPAGIVSSPRDYYSYNFSTPEKWVISAAGILGRRAIISADWEITNYRHMRMNYYDAGMMNTFIEEDFRTTHTLRAGVELKVMPQFSLRGGAEFRTGAIKPDVVKDIANNSLQIETAGTTPHFTVDKGSQTYTFGLGYRFTKSFYTDLACALIYNNADYYNFSALPYNPNDGEIGVSSDRGTIKTNRTKVLWTLGYKF